MENDLCSIVRVQLASHAIVAGLAIVVVFSEGNVCVPTKAIFYMLIKQIA